MTSPIDHLDAVTRRVGTVTHDGVELRNITVRRTLADAPAEVWAALTEADLVAQWFVPVSGDLEAGGHFQLEGNAAGEVLECVAPERFAVTWALDTRSDDGHASRVDVSLRPVADGTLLQLDHSVPVVDDRLAELGPGSVGIGWELALTSLAGHLADPAGEAGTPDDLDAFLAGSGRQWAEAAVADGDDPERARAAARRCVAAYAGD